LIQYRIWHNDIKGFLGLAISHPLFYIIAIAVKQIPWGEFGHRVNLVSAVAGAVTVANVFLFVRLLSARAFPAIIAAASLAVSHTFWWHASVIETYTLWAAFFTGELVVLLQYFRTRRVGYLYWLGLLNGLAIAVHMLASISLVCYAVMLAVLLKRREIKLGNLGCFAAAWVVGAIPYEYLIIRTMFESGDVAGTMASAAFGARWRGNVLNMAMSAKLVKENILFFGLNFPTPNIALFFAGCAALYKLKADKSLRIILVGLILLYAGFALRYTISDRYAFFIPFYCLCSVTMGLGTYWLCERYKSKAVMGVVLAFAVVPVGVYAVAPRLVEKWQPNIGTRGDIPYRNDCEYFLKPWKTGYVGAERFAEEALDAAERGAVIWADATTVAPLLYVQETRNIRPDVKVVGLVSSPGSPRFDSTTVAAIVRERTVYVVSRKQGYCPAFVLENYELVKEGILWRIVGHPAPATGAGAKQNE
jgi:hypothetical protein